MKKIVFLVYTMSKSNPNVRSKVLQQVCGSEKQRDRYLDHYRKSMTNSIVFYESWRVM